MKEVTNGFFFSLWSQFSMEGYKPGILNSESQEPLQAQAEGVTA